MVVNESKIATKIFNFREDILTHTWQVNIQTSFKWLVPDLHRVHLLSGVHVFCPGLQQTNHFLLMPSNLHDFLSVVDHCDVLGSDQIVSDYMCYSKRELTYSWGKTVNECSYLSLMNVNCSWSLFLRSRMELHSSNRWSHAMYLWPYESALSIIPHLSQKLQSGLLFGQACSGL